MQAAAEPPIMSSSKHSSALHKAPSFDLYSQAAHHSGSGPPLHSSGGYAPNSRSGSDNSSGAFLQRQTSPSNDRSEKAQSPSSSQSSHLANLSPLSRSLWTNVKKSSSGPLMVSANDPTAWLTWKEVTVSVSLGGTDTHCILDNLSGYAEPGHLMAIMGPSGSGKSTLLDALAGRLAKNTIMSGEVRVNGRRRKLSYGSVAFVTQEDTLLGTLTVRETIFYSAHLRLPDSMPWHEKESIVEGTILEMGLQDCADTPVGNWHLRGLSGGEKRRVSIALEILMRPRLLFLDEPTSGLDSASAFFVMQTLRGLSRDGRTVLFSIHQPSSEVFALFDKLYLLSGGRTIYFGDAARSHEFFAQAGFPCPQRRNPSDHFLRCVNSDFERVKDSLKSSTRQRRNGAIDPLDKHTTAEVIDILTDAYNNSGQAVATAVKVYSISQIKGLVLESSGSQASFLMQAKTLTKRSFVNMTRDLGYYWLRLFIYIFVAICVGTMYFKVGTSYSSILARGACTSYVAGFVTFMSIGGFPSFIEDMKVFQRERLNGHYGVLAFVVANTLSSLPYLLAIALATGTICYYMAGLHPGLDHYLFFAINLLGCIAVVESLMMAIASVVSNFLLGIITGAGLLGVFMLVAGFFRLPDDLPKIFWRYPMSYLSFNYWALQGQYKNDYWGLLFDNISPLLPPITGEEVLRDKFQISLSWSKWWDTAMVYVFMIVYRLIFFLNIKLSENVTPYVRAFLNKRTSQWKAQRLSSKTVIPVNKQSPDARHQ